MSTMSHTVQKAQDSSSFGGHRQPAPSTHYGAEEGPIIIEVFDLNRRDQFVEWVWDHQNRKRFVERVANILNSILLFLGSIWSVISVSVYVTGYWEITQKKKYCFGPAPNPIPSQLPGEQVNVVVNELEAIIKHSFWPHLEATMGSPNDENSGHDYDIRPETEVFHGLFRSADVCAATYLLPRQRRVFIYSRYELFPVPTAEQVGEAYAEYAVVNDMPDVFTPLKSGYIRGTEALRAARRAGWRSEL
ncbi:hypothetical protein EW145_g7237 [Phellinidium pouzarii]|uniref:Uncharacterized protein n=1 Tax=Phellinidium pouzarii TaxID=167371 RepID=A0A4S4KM58_9AGAM|nr:hypothetical protein EW145_g7237 [Phellinidium pouzarii]